MNIALPDDVELRRLNDRAGRMQAVVRELEVRASFHRRRTGAVPPPLPVQ